jgi:hypothetical protein
VKAAAIACINAGSRELDLRFVNPGAAAGRAPAGLGEFVLAEGKPTRAALGGADDDLVAGSPRRPDHVAQVVRNVTLFETERSRNRRDGPRLSGQEC